MTDTGRDCPDCGVSMEPMELKTTGGSFVRFVSDAKREGILGKLGARQTYDSETLVCPDCGLSRIYADLDDDGDVDASEDEAADDDGSTAGESGDDPATDDGEAEGWSFE